ncbi:MAG: 3-deoxy-D-manno-octulosonic acid transferase, partial [Kiritimatiellae bacterium]|nr:3-deoxy-D-manno-octulosonic acid transferase [Kiritimatiellia bacterium]
GLRADRKSRLDKGAVAVTPLTADDVLLVDTTGELMGFYPHAALVFVGKSLTAQGAQNMIEPGLCGVPVLVGPHTQNFRPVMADLLAAQALLQVADAASLESEIARLLASPAERTLLGQRAVKAVESRRGVVARSAQRLLAALRDYSAMRTGVPSGASM